MALHPALARSFSFDERLREIDMFFQGTDRVHQTMQRVAEKLEEANIPYAIVGGMAVNAHGHKRTTGDVDFLVTGEGLTAFARLYVGPDFDRVPRHPRRFVDRNNGVHVDFLVTGLFPGSGKPGPIAYPDPADVSERIENRRVVTLTTLVQLKLAARRYQDFADVVNLIRAQNLDESFATRLHPAVHGDYIECLEEKRRDDEYELRQDQAFEQIYPTDEGSEPPKS
ncbi:MAG: hypothetical protein K2R98_33255 [Gemmataceae bacterium]|nr:hypothetical protein [Gemmataceae bacterium]